jgi:hypothetical protein
MFLDFKYHRFISHVSRFKKPGSKNYQNIYPPSATLHISNIAPPGDEPDVRAAFKSIDIEVQVSMP